VKVDSRKSDPLKRNGIGATSLSSAPTSSFWAGRTSATTSSQRFTTAHATLLKNLQNTGHFGTWVPAPASHFFICRDQVERVASGVQLASKSSFGWCKTSIRQVRYLFNGFLTQDTSSGSAKSGRARQQVDQSRAFPGITFFLHIRDYF